jgi:DNA polymerase-4
MGRGPWSAAEIDAAAMNLVDRVTRRMRAADRIGRTVTIRLRFDDFARATRSHTLDRATAHTGTILQAVRDLVAGAQPLIEGRGITLLGITVSNLDDDAEVQLQLPFDKQSTNVLDTTIDAIKEKFGKEALGRTTLVGRRPDLEMPMLPD